MNAPVPQAGREKALDIRARRDGYPAMQAARRGGSGGGLGAWRRSS